jgi:hypothetical protein
MARVKFSKNDEIIYRFTVMAAAQSQLIYLYQLTFKGGRGTKRL